MLDEFLLRALAGGLGVALAAGPLGCFMVWRRMAYFGDTLAHSGLLGVALGIVLGISPGPAAILCCLGLATLLVVLEQRRQLATDTLLGILSHTALSTGLVALAFFETVRVDLVAYLFGDILAVRYPDLAWIWGGGLLVLGVLIWQWRPLIAMTVHEDLARVEGVPVLRLRFGLMLLVALVIAVAMKVVGILLITSLLIIPAAAARPFATTPEIMAVLASILGSLAVILGLAASLTWDTPTGPSIVLAASGLFVVGNILGGTVSLWLERRGA